jgi:hypothetical protein
MTAQQEEAMLYLHETHEIVGGKTAAFEDALRDVWRPRFERHGRARLLWCWHHTHGTGPSYQAVTLSAVHDWATWGTIAQEMRAGGEWNDWWDVCWALRREVVAKLLLPAPWSPLQDIDLTNPPAPAEPSLYLHDTGWPHPGKLDGYVRALGEIFYPQTARSRMIRVEGCWTTAPGTGRHHEVLLLQKILDWSAFSRLLTQGEQPARAGEWMEAGLRYRDRWESKLLRPASWSPWR